MNCLLCQRPLHPNLTLPWLLSWRPLVQPVVCVACWQQFQPIMATSACLSCGRAQATRTPCRDCQRWNQPDFYNQALFEYNSAMQAYFKQYKFKGDFRLRQVFAAVLQARLAQLRPTLMVTIPVTPATMLTRGFNQVTGWLANGENQSWLQTAAVAKTIAQSAKTREDRLATPQPFVLSPTTPKLQGQTIVIVDDVYTTGRTIRHAADLLLESGAKQVIGLTLSR
ncbi:ComF family protein [Lactobacillus sp. CBA3606]|uniref:ComF family protein n=1 Tax=Lactobacillus sp. CBA3606 TaxID=2099789 RepID=UPI000CFCF5FE|nr:ComF family protein [Lactobacillus sp. CBA3606]AVK64507.1 ComF family protein [Lactobacillus sp. CBA3606]